MNSYDLSELNIVLAEHSPLMRRLMRSVMRELGVHDVLAVPNAETAYEHFKTATPDVIFTDWSPGLDGLELIQEARTGDDSPNPYVPIVVVTAYTDLQHVVRARDSGINEYLAKPVSATRIYSRICSLVENGRPFIRCGDFFGPDRRRRRIDHGGHERRGQAKSTDSDPQKTNISGYQSWRQDPPGDKAPERRQRKRLGVEKQENKRLIKGINDPVPT